MDPEQILETLVNGRSSDKPNIGHDVQITEINGAFEHYITGAARFKVGDWVTTRVNGYRKHAGNPARIVEIREDAEPNFNHEDDGSPTFGAPHDIRIMRRHGNALSCYWVESWELEPYEAA